MEPLYIIMRNWQRFQHYKDRNPTWIKTYVELLHSDAYLSLSGHRRGVLHGLWLEYASSTCQLRLDTVSITRRLNLRVTMKDLDALNHAGFIEYALAPVYQDASQSASPEKEKDKEKRFSRPLGDQTAVGRIRKMIHNGALTELPVLQAELRGGGINGEQADALIHELEKTTAERTPV